MQGTAAHCPERSEGFIHPFAGEDAARTIEKVVVTSPRGVLREAIIEDRIVIASPRSNLILTFQLSDTHSLVGPSETTIVLQFATQVALANLNRL